MRKINISNASKRNAEVAFGATVMPKNVIYRTKQGDNSCTERRVKLTLQTDDNALLTQYGDKLADVLMDNDPDIDMELFGLSVDQLSRVYLTPTRDVAYGITLNEHFFFPDGTPKEITKQSSLDANIAVENIPIRWTGKMIPRTKAMRMFLFKRSYQIQHINGLTYDFLYDIAKRLHESDSMMLLGAGSKGVDPIVLTNGGIPYRAFLEGRVEGESYALIMRLTNMELKSILSNE